MTTYDESNARITNALTGLKVDHVLRNGKTIEIHTTCGHVMKLQSDINHDIQCTSFSKVLKIDPQIIGALAKL